MASENGLYEVDLKQDSLRSWIVAVAAFTAHLITHGIVYSFGVLFLTIQDTFKGASKTQISWIPSFTTCSLYLIGPVAGALINRYSCRIVCIIGSILGFVGYVGSVFVKDLYILYVSLGIVAGCGFGMVFLPSILIVTKYFKKYRALACGFALSGAGCGAFGFSPLLEHLTDVYAWQGTILILSAIILNCIPCGLIFHSSSTLSHKRETSETIVIEIVQDDRYPKHSETKYIFTDNTDETMKDKHGCIEKFDVKLPPQSACRRYILLFKCTKVIVFFLSQFFFFAGFYLPFIYIPDKAKMHAIPEHQAAWIASTIGMSSITGRIVLGYLADRPFVNRMTMFKAALLVTGISTTILPVMNTLWLLIIYAIIYGISSGITLSLTSVVLVDLVGIDLLPDALGLNNLFSALGALAGPPIAGVLFDKTQSYTASFLSSGISMTSSGLMLIFASIFLQNS